MLWISFIWTLRNIQSPAPKPSRLRKYFSVLLAGWHLCSLEPQLAKQLRCFRGCFFRMPPGPLHEVQDDSRPTWGHPGPPGRRPRLPLLHRQRLHWNCQRWRRHGYPRLASYQGETRLSSRSRKGREMGRNFSSWSRKSIFLLQFSSCLESRDNSLFFSRSKLTP